MKKYIFITLLFLPFITNVYSQVIPNASFEDWTLKTLYEEPQYYATTNLQAYFNIATGNVTKTTDCQHGAYAAHLQTIAANDTMTGAMFIGMPGAQTITGGTPYNQKPTALQGYAKYNILTNDTAMIMVFLKRNDTIMAVASINPTGTQMSYTQFTAPIIWIDTVSSHIPDTLVALISCSNFNNPIPGSELFLDNLTFLGATLPFPNGDFENWNALSYDEPDSWFTINFISLVSGTLSATKTTDHYGTGAYALKLETIVFPSDNTTDTMGFVTNGRFGDNGPRGGLKVDNYPMKVSGYYKYTPVGLDTALAAVFLFGHDVMNNLLFLDSNMMSLPATNTYTYFELNLSYQGPELPDTLNISFSSSNMKDSADYMGAGSILYLDELQVTYFPVSVQEQSLNLKNVNLFPNPAKDYIYMNLSPENNFDKIKIFDFKGSLLLEEPVLNLSRIDVSQFANGMYMYQFISNKKTESGKFVICK